MVAHLDPSLQGVIFSEQKTYQASAGAPSDRAAWRFPAALW
jgi:hypothetical protein